jgi:acyl-CoA dehydrogenase
MLTTHNATRDRLTYGIFCGDCDQPVEQLRLAFDQVMAVRPLRDRMRKAGISEVDAALAKGVVSDADAQQLREAAEAVDLVIAVDDFAPSSISAFVTSDQPEMPPEKAARTR